MKVICSRYRAKNLSDFTNFPANMFLFGARKNICTAPFLDVQELHSWSTLKANFCIFVYISLRKCLFQRDSKVLSGGGWVWGRLNNFLKAACCLGLANVLQFFILIEIFDNSAIFQHFDTSIYSIETLKFSRQFRLEG